MTYGHSWQDAISPKQSLVFGSSCSVAKKQTTKDLVKVDRRTKERREVDDRRKQAVPVAKEQRQSERRKVQRRRQIDPTTCERDYSEDEIEFMHALDRYKRASGRMFPTCSEILEVLRNLGYQKCADGPQEPPIVAIVATDVATVPSGGSIADAVS